MTDKGGIFFDFNYSIFQKRSILCWSQKSFYRNQSIKSKGKDDSVSLYWVSIPYFRYTECTIPRISANIRKKLSSLCELSIETSKDCRL